MKTFETLFEELQEKVRTQDPQSRTVREVEAGVHFIGKKIVEEAAEVWMAAEYETDEDLALEISQLLYHLQALMIAKNLPMNAVYDQL